jgi:hypothetical protein
MEMAELSEDEEGMELIQKRPLPRPARPSSPSPSPSISNGTGAGTGAGAGGLGNKQPIMIAFLIICVIAFSTGFSMLRSDPSEGRTPQGKEEVFTPYEAPVSVAGLTAAAAGIEAAMDRIHMDWRVDEYPVFKALMHIPAFSWDMQVHKLTATLLRRRPVDKPYTFVTVFTGSSVTAGHDNYIDEMFSSVFNDVMAPIFSKLGMKLETRNVAIGNNPCIPYDACLATHAGQDADLIAWEQSMNCGRQPSPVEFFIRNTFALPKKVHTVDTVMVLSWCYHLDVVLYKCNSRCNIAMLILCYANTILCYANEPSAWPVHGHVRHPGVGAERVRFPE